MISYHTLSDDAKVWIYQSSRRFTETETEAIRSKVKAFTNQWASHSRQLQAYGEVFHNQFIVFIVDETQAGASGCSIDASVHFLKDLEQTYSLDLFNRMKFSYLDNDQVHTVDRAEFKAAFQAGKITPETKVFDNLVNNKFNFQHHWIKPIKASWHEKML